MSAKIIQIRTPSAVIEAAGVDGDASQSPAQLQQEIERLEQLDHDLQVQAHRLNLTIGEVRRKRLDLAKRIARVRSA